MNKGFIFGGDSFVWGEGLDLFSDCSIIKKIREEKKYESYDGSEKYSQSSFEFQELNRFPNLVAKHFKTFSLVFDRNGGDNYSCLDELIYLIRNTDLNQIKYVIYQPTSVFRTCNILLHPIMTTFGQPSEISTFTTKKKYLPIGNGKGLKKYNVGTIGNNLTDTFQKIDDDFLLLLQCAIAYEGKQNLDEFIEESVYYDGITKEDIELYYNFVMEEYSDYGNDTIEIFENIEKKLVSDCIDFVHTQIYPMLEDYNDIKFYFLETWCGEIETWRTTLYKWYHKNRIQISPTWQEVEHKYQISHTEDLGWTHNLHPTIEGHQFITKNITNHLDK